MITKRQFTARLNMLGNSSEALLVALVEVTSFALFHARAHGQKTPWAELTAAAATWRPWLRGPFTRWADKQKVALRKGYTAEQAEKDAAEAIERIFDGQERKRQEAAARRAAKKAQEATQASEASEATPAPENAPQRRETPANDIVVDVEARERPTDMLVIGGREWVLTAEEASELGAVLAAMRAGRRVAELESSIVAHA